MFSKILVPVDLDNVDKLSRALDTAAEIAKREGAKVTYLGVVDAAPTSSARTDSDRLEERLDAFAEEQAKAHGIETADQVALRGDLHLNVGSEIVTTAKDSGCDLVVMASHVPGLLEHVLSSNAGYVASHAPMSVFVVR